MRQTWQRRLVYEALAELGHHCTADEIAAFLSAREVALARSTVYRALEALTGAGAVRAVQLGTGATHYEVAVHDHQHAVCGSCGGVLHLEEELVRAIRDHLRRKHHFQPARVDVLVTGTCVECEQSGAGKPLRRRTLDHVHY
jgi:Fur family ferric uptake transcriptional regulator